MKNNSKHENDSTVHSKALFHHQHRSTYPRDSSKKKFGAIRQRLDMFHDVFDLARYVFEILITRCITIIRVLIFCFRETKNCFRFGGAAVGTRHRREDPASSDARIHHDKQREAGHTQDKGWCHTFGLPPTKFLTHSLGSEGQSPKQSIADQ